ncbi:MAG: FkbM family methyltransferase [Usitatibacter sp.]
MQLTLEQYEKINPQSEIEEAGVKMHFTTPTAFTYWRVQSIRRKEPWTLEWIAGFDVGDTLLDCGANVGMYTIWAAATRKSRVYAFEPESQNYALLNRNIQLNQLADLVTAYCIGLSDRSGLSVLHMADMRIGGSCHAVGEPLDYKQQPLTARFRQGCFAVRLDELVASGDIPVPKHIKIDVDGFEHKVIAGARVTLADPALKSMLIETNGNLADHRAMVDELAGLGFRFDPAQVERAIRKDGPFKGVAEYVFTR